VWEKKFGQPPTTEQEKAKQIRFMQSRGFGWEVIKLVMTE
jgi:regulatory protein